MTKTVKHKVNPELDLVLERVIELSPSDVWTAY